MSAVHHMMESGVRHHVEGTGPTGDREPGTVGSLDYADEECRGGQHSVCVGHWIGIVDLALALPEHRELGTQQPLTPSDRHRGPERELVLVAEVPPHTHASVGKVVCRVEGAERQAGYLGIQDVPPGPGAERAVRAERECPTVTVALAIVVPEVVESELGLQQRSAPRLPVEVEPEHHVAAVAQSYRVGEVADRERVSVAALEVTVGPRDDHALPRSKREAGGEPDSKAVDEIVAVNGLTDAIELVLKVGGQSRQPDWPASSLYREALSLVSIVAERNSRQPDGAPIAIELTIEQVSVLELGRDIRISHSPSQPDILPTGPVGVVDQPRLDRGTGHQHEITEGGRTADLGIGVDAIGSDGV